ncbi:MAG: hypothetical protein ACI35W_04825 [Anaeroplasmataceae bacterium]
MKKASSIAKAYAIFSQGIISTIILAGLGFFIGWKIDKTSALKGILAVVGALIGIISFIFMVYKANYFTDKPKENEGETKDEK